MTFDDESASPGTAAEPETIESESPDPDPEQSPAPAEDVEERASRLTSFIFVAPTSLRVTLPANLLLGLVFTLLLTREPVELAGGLTAMLVMLLICLTVTPLLVRTVGGELYRPHTLLALLFVQIVAILTLVTGLLVSPFYDPGLWLWAAFALGVGASFWLLVLRALATPSLLAWPLALLPFLAQGAILQLSLGQSEWGPLLAGLGLLPLAGLGLLILIDTPFQRTLNVRGTELMRDFIAYLGRGSKALESSLARFASPGDLQVGVVAFRRPREKRPYLSLVIPTHHPGPVGELGGSNLPQRLAEALKERSENVMVFHGASLNDHNPVESQSVQRLATAVTEELLQLTYSPSTTAPVWQGKENCCVGQRFGGGTLLLGLPPVSLYDDVEPAVGRAAQALARETLQGPAIFGDAHSQYSVNAPPLNLEDPAATRLLKRVSEVVEGLASRPELPFTLGYGRAGTANLPLGLGPMGVQAAVVEVSGERTAYLLFDANGMDKTTRAKLLAGLEQRVDHLVLATTDNHFLNTLRGGANPVGHHGQWRQVLDFAEQALEAAIEDLTPAEAGMGLTRVNGELIFGRGNSNRMTCLVNNVAAACKATWLPLYGGASLLYWVLVEFFF